MSLEVAVISELSRTNLAEDDPKGKDVGWKIKLFVQEDFRGHVRIGAAECEPLRFLLIAGRDTCESEIGDFEATVGGDEEVFAFEIAMDAFTGVKVCQGTGDVRGEGEPELPWEWSGFVVYIYANVAILDIL